MRQRVVGVVLIMTEMSDFNFPVPGLFKHGTKSAGFSYIAFLGKVAFADNGIFHPLHIFAVFATDTLNHTCVCCHVGL